MNDRNELKDGRIEKEKLNDASGALGVDQNPEPVEQDMVMTEDKQEDAQDNVVAESPESESEGETSGMFDAVWDFAKPVLALFGLEKSGSSEDADVGSVSADEISMKGSEKEVVKGLDESAVGSEKVEKEDLSSEEGNDNSLGS